MRTHKNEGTAASAASAKNQGGTPTSLNIPNAREGSPLWAAPHSRPTTATTSVSATAATHARMAMRGRATSLQLHACRHAAWHRARPLPALEMGGYRGCTVPQHVRRPGKRCEHCSTAHALSNGAARLHQAGCCSGLPKVATATAEKKTRTKAPTNTRARAQGLPLTCGPCWRAAPCFPAKIKLLSESFQARQTSVDSS